MLTGKALIACEPSDSADGRFSAGGSLAEFEEVPPHTSTTRSKRQMTRDAW